MTYLNDMAGPEEKNLCGGLHMKRTLRMLLASSAMLVTQLAFAGELDGTWLVDVAMQSGTSRSTFTLGQRGDAVTGEYAGHFGEAPVAGTVTGNIVALGYTTEVQGVPVEVNYRGTIDGEVMTGTVTIVGFAVVRSKGRDNIEAVSIGTAPNHMSTSI